MKHKGVGPEFWLMVILNSLKGAIDLIVNGPKGLNIPLGSMGPAELYLQGADIMMLNGIIDQIKSWNLLGKVVIDFSLDKVGGAFRDYLGINYTLSGVGNYPHRDFAWAAKALMILIKKAVTANWKDGMDGRPIQLFIVFHWVNEAGETGLFELGPVWFDPRTGDFVEAPLVDVAAMRDDRERQVTELFGMSVQELTDLVEREIADFPQDIPISQQ